MLDKERIYPVREPKCLDTQQKTKHGRIRDMLQTFGSTTNTVSLVALMLYRAVLIVSRAIEITRVGSVGILTCHCENRFPVKSRSLRSETCEQLSETNRNLDLNNSLKKQMVAGGRTIGSN